MITVIACRLRVARIVAICMQMATILITCITWITFWFLKSIPDGSVVGIVVGRLGTVDPVETCEVVFSERQVSGVFQPANTVVGFEYGVVHRIAVGQQDVGVPISIEVDELQPG